MAEKTKVTSKTRQDYARSSHSSEGETDPGEEQPMLCGANKQPSKTASRTRFMSVVSQLSDEDLALAGELR